VLPLNVPHQAGANGLECCNECITTRYPSTPRVLFLLTRTDPLQ
jgi:hypothetical protein